MELEENDHDETVFRLCHGSVFIVKMAFCLQISCSMFQKTVDFCAISDLGATVLSLPRRHRRHSLPSKTEHIDIDYVKQILSPGRDTGSLKVKTYSRFTRRIASLGYMIHSRRLEIASHTLDPIKSLKSFTKVVKRKPSFWICIAFTDCLQQTFCKGSGFLHYKHNEDQLFSLFQTRNRLMQRKACNKDDFPAGISATLSQMKAHSRHKFLQRTSRVRVPLKKNWKFNECNPVLVPFAYIYWPYIRHIWT